MAGIPQASPSNLLRASTTLPLLSSRPKRNLGFLLRTADKDRVCGFPEENRMVLINAAISTGHPGERSRGICSFCPLSNTSQSEHRTYPEVVFLDMATRNSFKSSSVSPPLIHNGRILP